jgi:hypothetical protein
MSVRLLDLHTLFGFPVGRESVRIRSKQPPAELPERETTTNG